MTRELRYTFVFNLQPLESSPLVRVSQPGRGGPVVRRTDFETLARLRRELTERHGVMCDGEERLPLDGEEGEVTLAHAERLCSEHGLRLEALRLYEDLVGHAEWFVLKPRCWSRVEPDEALPGTHAMSDLSPFVSERFIRCVTDARLRGLAFAWADDAARFRAMRWYRAWATRPIGRGVHHPWFDPASLDGRRVESGECVGAYLHGRSTFNGGEVRAAARVSAPELRRFLGLAGSPQPAVFTVPRVLRRCLPDADFAYWWTMSDFRAQGELNPRGARQRTLCMSRRARDVLVEAAMIDASEASPIMVLEEAPEGCEALDDRPEPMPRPCYSPEELASYSREIEPKYREWLQRPRLDRVHSVEAVIALLERHGPELAWEASGFTGEQWQKAGSLTGLRVPRSYRLLAERLPEYIPAVAHDDCYLWDPGRLASDHVDYQRGMRGEFPAGLLHFASTACGDWFSFMAAEPGMPEDCPVVKWDHETGEMSRRWESVPSFVQEMIVDSLAEAR